MEVGEVEGVVAEDTTITSHEETDRVIVAAEVVAEAVTMEGMVEEEVGAGTAETEMVATVGMGVAMARTRTSDIKRVWMLVQKDIDSCKIWLDIRSASSERKRYFQGGVMCRGMEFKVPGTRGVI